MRILNSLDNQTIKDLVKLHTSKGRREQQSFLAEGIRCIETLVQSGTRLEQIFVVEEQLRNLAGFSLNDDLITVVSEKVMAKISQAVTPSGIVAQFVIPVYAFDSLATSHGLVLSQIQDPGNMGTLIRTSVALSITTLITISGSTDPWSYKVVQASAGTVGYAKIYDMSWENFSAQTSHALKIGLVISGGKKPNQIAQLLENKKNIFLVVGSEAHGLSPEQQSACDALMTLAMPSGNTESLNAAVAGAIALYSVFQLYT